MSKRDEVLSSTTDEPKPKKDIATHSVQTADFSWSAPLRHGDCKLSGFLKRHPMYGSILSGFVLTELQSCCQNFSNLLG